MADPVAAASIPARVAGKSHLRKPVYIFVLLLFLTLIEHGSRSKSFLTGACWRLGNAPSKLVLKSYYAHPFVLVLSISRQRSFCRSRQEFWDTL